MDATLADSRHWLQYTTLQRGYLTLHSLDAPKQNIRLPFPNSKFEEGLDKMVTTSDHLLTIVEQLDDDVQPNDLRNATPNWAGLDIHEYRLLPHISLLHTLHVSAPPGVKMEGAKVSSSGQRIAWICSQFYISPFVLWLHRWLPRISTNPQRRFGLWVSNIDGSRMHEIGHVLLAPQDEAPTTFELNWLPGDKRLSFVYKAALYTVPTD
jgi:hypothetical protein